MLDQRVCSFEKEIATEASNTLINKSALLLTWHASEASNGLISKPALLRKRRMQVREQWLDQQSCSVYKWGRQVKQAMAASADLLLIQGASR